jgi:hypothetical protein
LDTEEQKQEDFEKTEFESDISPKTEVLYRGLARGK